MQEDGRQGILSENSVRLRTFRRYRLNVEGAGRLRPFFAGLRDRISHWIAEEADFGHDDLTAPAGFLLGVMLYFSAPAEPGLPGAALLSLSLLGVFLWRRSVGKGHRIALFVLAVSTGFFAGTLQGGLSGTDILSRETTVELAATIVSAEDRGRRTRLVIRTGDIIGDRQVDLPGYVQVSVPHPRTGAYLPGDRISGLFRLSPPGAPLHPGGMDFRRYFYFQGTGAIGFSYGHPAKFGETDAYPLRRSLTRLRASIADRIGRTLDTREAGVARALMIGDRGGLQSSVEDVLRKTGLAHMLAISGMHMAIFAGLAFFAVRAVLALSAELALKRSVKKAAAVAALMTGLFYLVLSGASVSTQRAFIMAGLFFAAILIGREALTLRTLAIAAVLVLILDPYSILSPGYQMSFMAALWLVAVYQTARRRNPSEPSADGMFRIPALILRPLYLILLTSLIAGIATLPFSLYHFGNAAPLSLLANLLAVPVFSFVTMPLALLSLIAMPYGFEALFLVPLGWSISLILGIASFVAGISPEVPPTGQMKIVLLMITACGMVLFGICRTPLKWAGMSVFAAGFAAALLIPVNRPDILIAADARSVAFRSMKESSRYIIMQARRDRFTRDQWEHFLAGDAPENAGEEFLCDKTACVAATGAGHRMALIIEPSALRDACQFATLIIWPFWSTPACENPEVTVISRRTLQQTGAVAYRIDTAAEPDKPPPLYRVWTAADQQGYRPWSIRQD